MWATGIAMNPLIKTVQSQLPGQNHFRCVCVVVGGAHGYPKGRAQPTLWWTLVSLLKLLLLDSVGNITLTSSCHKPGKELLPQF